MSVLSDNLRYMRALRNKSQQFVANALVIGRARYAKYEEAAAEPPLDVLRRISKFYNISIDLLVGFDLHRISAEKLLREEKAMLDLTDARKDDLDEKSFSTTAL